MNDDRSMYVAVDLGAGSGRVFLVGMGAAELTLEEVRRFTYPPRQADGHLRWDARRIFDEIAAGLAAVGTRARELGRPVESIGIDSWGVDYGLLDAEGRLVEDPVCYRDGRTNGVMEQVFARMPRAEIFERTGIQLLPINTLFQLFAHVREGLPAAAARLLMIPDLVNAFLTGVEQAEFTNATTTQLLNAATGTWDAAIIDSLGLPARLFPSVVAPGTDVGALRDDLRSHAGLECARVVAPGTHDTASAVAGACLEPGWAFISSGTWSLVGVERMGTLIDREVSRENFTNEGGVNGTTRFLKNVAGLWLLEACRKEWQAAGIVCDYDRLLGEAAALDVTPGLVFPDDPRLLNPPSMVEALTQQLRETGQAPEGAPAALTRIILDSLASRYTSVLSAIERLTGQPVDAIRIVGGGSRNAYLNQATATASGKPVVAGPAEATVIGNALVQAVTAGRFHDVASGRSHVAARVRSVSFQPEPHPAWDRNRARYASIEARYVNG